MNGAVLLQQVVAENHAQRKIDSDGQMNALPDFENVRVKGRFIEHCIESKRDV